MPLRNAVLLMVVFATALGAQDFPLGIVEKNVELEFELPFPTVTAAGAGSSIATDCECLTALGPSAEAVADKPMRVRFKYRSPTPGSVRVSAWLQGATSSATAERCTVTGFVYERSWVVTPNEARNDPTAIFIDTRWKQQFERVRIPRSLNVPAFALKSRTDLRERRVVLVDGGFAPEELLGLVRSFRSQGFHNVVYLAGGLPAWLRDGGAHEGTAAEPVVEAATISPIDLARAKKTSAWQLVNFSADASSGAWASKSDLLRLSAVIHSPVISGLLPPPTLAIAEDDTSYARIERSFAQPANRPLYYLGGGTHALASFQRTQEALVNRPAEPFQTGIAAPRPLMGSGCGTCPKR